MPDPGTENVLQGRTFDAVLFDMDGTLIDSTPAVNRSWALWAEEWGVAKDETSHGRPARDIIEELVPAERVDEAIARILELETADTNDITVLPGAAALMNSLPESRRAIVTSCARPLAVARLGASALAAPKVIVTIDDTPRGKPFPEPFLEGAARLGVDPRRCLVIEDAPAGLQAGRAAGCTTIGVAGTYAAAELDADLIVPGLDHLRIEVAAGGLIFRLVSPNS
ncbi:HAD family hydrolase [Cryobacterium sp. TMT1-2-2]|uniref:HAD-IA family hydrolase n=1 Tax=Cryobacterium sp. TMT1-2-2 TaxID=1259233 RepID=UPI00106B5D5C|nr:HAD-IA family hydrolase [Cryobacterium sp. TMT1-2-2]TFD08756.1 HAD family hydrolase [Cryobacterium sp. TMT1-2-2]